MLYANHVDYQVAAVEGSHAHPCAPDMQVAALEGQLERAADEVEAKGQL